MKKKYLILLKNIPNSRLECTNHSLFQNKMIEIDTLLQTKTATKNIAFGAAYTYIAYIRDHPPPPPRAKIALQIMSLAAYASKTKHTYFGKHLFCKTRTITRARLCN